MTEAREDLAQYKSHLREYLVKRGIKITKTDAERISCLSGTHADNHPSMIVYASEGNLYCPACGAKMDIFEAARTISGIPSGNDNFPKVIEEVKNTLGIFTMSADVTVAAAPVKKHVEKNTTFVSLPLEEARHYYVESTVLDLASKTFRAKVKHIENTWKNIDPDGKIAFIECRFPASDFEDGKKKYLTFWFEGERVRAANPPYLLYNRDKLAANPDLPVVIHEGPKCIFIAEKGIQGFVHTGWNSGGKKFSLVDFEPLRGRNVIIYPDDDVPGRKTALEVYDCIKLITASCRICEPLEEARSIKPQGSDIVEALQVRTPEAMAEYFISGPEMESFPPANVDAAPEGDEAIDKTDIKKNVKRPPSANRNQGDLKAPGPNPDDVPFKFLGTTGEGQTYFIDESGRLHVWTLSSLTKGNLIVLAPLPWWDSQFGNKGKISWDDATDYVVRISSNIDFDPDTLRGCGAWREDDGRICYNDGRKVIGEPSKDRIYLKGTYRDLGLEGPIASIEVRKEMVACALGMSFETKQDAIKLLAWSVLAPFGGALPWRPAGFITGDSESGKTTAMNLIVRSLSACGSKDTASGGETSAAGIRQHDKDSSRPVAIEEAEDDSDKKKRTRSEQFSLMRESTSDDSPKAWKGTLDGRGIQFTLRKMFIFAAISPIVNAKADANRLFFVNMVKGDPQKWRELKPRAHAAFKEAKCKGVRAYTWAHLKEIIKQADRFADFIEEVGHRSSRYAYLEGILYAAYWIVFEGKAPDDNELREFLADLFKDVIQESISNSAEEMVNRILDEQVPLEGDRSKSFTLRRLLLGIRYGTTVDDSEGSRPDSMRYLSKPELTRYKSTAILYGLGISGGHLAIVNKHHQIQKITGTGENYSMILRRHPGLVDSNKTCNFTGIGDTVRRCTILEGVIVNDEPPDWGLK